MPEAHCPNHVTGAGDQCGPCATARERAAIESDAQALAARLRRSRAVNARATEILTSLEGLPRVPVQRLKKLDDAVKLVDDVELCVRSLSGVAGRLRGLVNELVDLLGIHHDSPSVGGPDDAPSVAGEPTVGDAPGAGPSAAPGAPSGGDR